MDADIVEIPPPAHLLKKQKRAILPDVIYVDDENDDSDDLVIFGEKVSKSNKRKTTEAIDDCIWEDYTDVDEYALLQTRLDSPWYDTQSDAKNSHVTDSFQPSWSLEPNNSRIEGSTMGSSNLQIKMDNVDHSSGSELFFQLLSQTTSSKKKAAASQCSGHGLNLSLGVESSKSKRFLKSFRGKIKSASFGSKNHGLGGNLEGKRLLHADKPPVATKFKSAKKAADSSNSYHANFKNEIPWKYRSYKQFDTVSDTSDYHLIRENSMKRYPRSWAENIKDHWKSLGWSLPASKELG